MKKRVAVLGTIVLGASMTAVVAQQVNASRYPPVNRIEKVRDNLYVIGGQGGNTAVFVTSTGVVLVDTKVATNSATGRPNGEAILEEVRKVTNRAVTTIVNTHTHADHVEGNGFFPDAVEIVAHENTKANMLRMPELKATPTALPDRTFKDRLTVGRGDDRVDLYYFGPGHTDGDIFVVFPAVRAMHAGDLFAWQGLPFVTPGGSGVAYPDTLEKALKGIRNVDFVITGHMGTIQRWADLVEYAEFTRELVTNVEAARRAGRSATQAAAEMKLSPKFSGIDVIGAGRDAPRVTALIETIYSELAGR